VVRASMDADALISLPRESDVHVLMEALRKAGLTCAYRKGEARDPIGGVIKVADRFQNQVDLLLRIRGMTEAVFSRTVETHLIKSRVRVIGIEDFIAMKIFAASPKDLSDVAGVLAVSSKRVHLPLLKELMRPYGKAAERQLQALLQANRSE